MGQEAFDLVEEALASGGPDSVLEFLAQRFGEEKRYPLLFELRLMQARRRLGLPLVHAGPPSEVADPARADYEKAFIQAARETGSFYLADGDIARAWSYFRAIGEPALIAEALEHAGEGGEADRLIEIAFHEGVNPRRGFELVLANHGICRAITYFGQYPPREDRAQCLNLLVRTLYRELAASLRRTITEAEGQTPATESVAELMAGRDWLFEGNVYYVDTSHLVSILQYSPDLDGAEMIGRALELAAYGRKLGPMFQFRGTPPFEDIYVDHEIYLKALAGQDVEEAIAHFRRKVTESEDPVAAVETLVLLLVRLGRYREAIEARLEYSEESGSAQPASPSIFELCQMAGEYERLADLAREKDDLLHFAAGRLLESEECSNDKARAGC